MIHFFEDIVQRALETTHDSKEFSDILYDINRINQALHDIEKGTSIESADRLDSELRAKYLTINAMLSLANSLPKVRIGTAQDNAVLTIDARLKQDYYGILCHVALKKHIICEIKEFIKDID